MCARMCASICASFVRLGRKGKSAREREREREGGTAAKKNFKKQLADEDNRVFGNFSWGIKAGCWRVGAGGFKGFIAHPRGFNYERVPSRAEKDHDGGFGAGVQEPAHGDGGVFDVLAANLGELGGVP